MLTQLLGGKDLLTSMKITCKGLGPGLETWRWEGAGLGEAAAWSLLSWSWERALSCEDGSGFIHTHTHLVSSGHMGPSRWSVSFEGVGLSAAPSPAQPVPLQVSRACCSLLPSSAVLVPTGAQGWQVPFSPLHHVQTKALGLWGGRGRVSGDSGRCSSPPSCTVKETFLGLPQALLWAPGGLGEKAKRAQFSL